MKALLARNVQWIVPLGVGAHRVFYSGDTALHDEFTAIGKRLGRFDLTTIESGAYSALWTDVHPGPEQAESLGVRVVSPRPGEMVEKVPVWSSGVRVR